MTFSLGLLRAAGWLCLAFAAISVFGAYAGALSPYLDFAGQLALQASLAAIVLATVFAVARQRTPAIASSVIAALGLFAVAPHGSFPSCGNRPTHRVLFLNVWADNPNIAQASDFVARSGADTIILGEVVPQFRPAFQRLRDLYPYHFECAPPRIFCDLYAYSRVPFEVQHIPSRHGWLHLKVSYPDGTLDLVGAHLTRPWPFRPAYRQVMQPPILARKIGASSDPRLIIGDFNAVTWGHVTKTMSRLEDAVSLPSGGTWRSNFPWPLRVPIDQILVGPGIDCARKTVGPETSSDHRPVWVDFAFAPKSPVAAR